VLARGHRNPHGNRSHEKTEGKDREQVRRARIARRLAPANPRARQRDAEREMAGEGRKLDREHVAHGAFGPSPMRAPGDLGLHPRLETVRGGPLPGERERERRRERSARGAHEERHHERQQQVELRLDRERPERAVRAERAAGERRRVLQEERVGRRVPQVHVDVAAPVLAPVQQRQHEREEEYELQVVRGHDATHAPGVEAARGRRGDARACMDEPRRREQEARDEEEEVHAEVAVARERLEHRRVPERLDPRIVDPGDRSHDDVVEGHHPEHGDAAQAIDRCDRADLRADAVAHQKGTRPA